VESAVQWAAHGVDAVSAVHGVSLLFSGDQPHRYVDAANHQDALFRFHLAGRVRSEPAVAGIDLTRLQRATKCAQHSTGGCRDHIVDGRGMRFGEARRIDLVVLCDGPVHAERHRPWLAGQVSNPQRSLPAFDADSGGVRDWWHRLSYFADSGPWTSPRRPCTHHDTSGGK